PDVAPEALELLALVLGLDALGDDGEAEVMAELDGGAHDGGVAAIGFHAAHESAVDLELVHRELLDVGERRVARAIIVDRGGDPEIAQLPQGRLSAARILHQSALRDLEAKERRG